MNRISRRLLGLLPLLAALAAVSAWVLLNTRSRERDVAEGSIRLRWEAPAEAAGVAKDVESYLARFGDDPGAAWFAVDCYAHLRDPRRALEVVTSRPRVRDEKGAARRLARTLIEPMRTQRGRSDLTTTLASSLLHVLLEAGDPDALRDWSDRAQTMSTGEAMSFFVPSTRTPSIGTRTIAATLASRTENRELRAAGAILLAGPAHVDDVPFLVELLRSSWRTERRPTWQNVARALGTTRDPRAIEALSSFVDGPGGDARLPTRGTLDVGLALAGDPDARRRLLADPTAVGGPRLLSIYTQGLAAQLAQGDERAVPRLIELWDVTREPMLRFEIGQAVLGADPMPPAAIPAGRWADELAASADLIIHTVGHAWRFRTGAEPAFASLAGDLVAAAGQVDLDQPRSPEEVAPGALIEVLRAWVRYGG